MKSLYSDSYFTPEEFWRLYNKLAYDALQRKYDPAGRFPDLYYQVRTERVAWLKTKTRAL